MHSRAIVILSLFALACIIVVGSIGIRFTSASASSDGPTADVSAMHQEEPNASPSGRLLDGGFSDAVREHPNALPGRATSNLTPRDIASADTLEMLLQRVHGMFEPQGSEVRSAMIPYLAEMIAIVNQYEDVIYRVEILDRDVGLAQSRARTLNDVLRLNVVDPSKLQIAGREGSRAVRVDASGS